VLVCVCMLLCMFVCTHTLCVHMLVCVSLCMHICNLIANSPFVYVKLSIDFILSFKDRGSDGGTSHAMGFLAPSDISHLGYSL
jgi:hypothetical protein